MSQKWNIDTEEMKRVLAEAREAGDTRLFAIAFDRESPLQWHHRKDEVAMQRFLDSRDRSESIMFNCAIAIVVVNPEDTDETIDAIIASRNTRSGAGPGYFEESEGF